VKLGRIHPGASLGSIKGRGCEDVVDVVCEAWGVVEVVSMVLEYSELSRSVRLRLTPTGIAGFVLRLGVSVSSGV
jgi:hypothetical protein